MGKQSKKPGYRRAPPATSWNPVAEWYNGWVGPEGSEHHRRLALPMTLELLDVQPDEKILDIGAGQGVLAPHILQAGAVYTGVDASAKLIQVARKHHPREARFLVGDARNLYALRELHERKFDAVVFLLSIQDMDPLDAVLRSASWALRPGGRVVLLMTHPCFRMPRQSGWGWDEARKLQYRRVDRYLTALAVPMKSYTGRDAGVTRSFHRPLQAYINGLARRGLHVDGMTEAPTYKRASPGPRASAEERANQEIPLFLGLRARKR
jgi:SAM-dependent methyltransferase